MWRPLPGGPYDRPYRIDQNNHVQSFKNGTWSAMNIIRDANGRACIYPIKAGKSVTVGLARAVWTAFVGPVKPDEYIVCRDHFRLDCSLCNLRKVNRREKGTFPGQKRCNQGRTPANAKPVVKLNEAMRIIGRYPSVAAAAEASYVSYATVYRHCTKPPKNCFRQLPYTFRFANG